MSLVSLVSLFRAVRTKARSRPSTPLKATYPSVQFQETLETQETQSRKTNRLERVPLCPLCPLSVASPPRLRRPVMTLDDREKLGPAEALLLEAADNRVAYHGSSADKVGKRLLAQAREKVPEPELG